MPWQYKICSKTLTFREAATTSRGTYTTRTVWYVLLYDSKRDSLGVGECAPLPDLSCDALPDYEAVLDRVCRNFVESDSPRVNVPDQYPSMRFGIETALLHAKARSIRFFKTPFARGEEDIPINGLVWMGDKETMLRRIEEKLEQGFTCLKCKIGGIDFASELELLTHIRERFPDPATLELRLDANGAFAPEDALQKLEALARFQPHSLEQPIKKGQWEAMREICKNSPIPIALDEELIGAFGEERQRLLDTVEPAFLVLKPSLHGGLKGCGTWLDLACSHNCGYWVTSALESNIGLNAIAQWCGTLDVTMPQGLGTGQLYTDNCPMPVHLEGSAMYCDPGAPEPDIRGWLGI